MSGPSTTLQSGIHDDDINIDGIVLGVPYMLQVNSAIRQDVSQTMNARHRISLPYDGALLPNGLDAFDFVIGHKFAEEKTVVGQTPYASVQSFFEYMRTAAAVHTLAFWKTYPYTWTLQPGAQLFYLPRPDAYSQGYAGKTGTAYQAIVTLNGVTVAAAKVKYQNVVDASTVVTATEVWISKTSVIHLEAGYPVAAIKFGTAMAAVSTVTVEYVPLFQVGVTQIVTQPFSGDTPFREDKAIYLTEV